MLHVHRAARADALAHGLADLLATGPADPFTADVVAVPTRGVERWISQQLSHRLGAAGDDGVCSLVEFPHPRDLVGQVLAAGQPDDADHDPWRPERSAWPLLGAVLDGGPRAPWAAALAAHLPTTRSGADDVLPTGANPGTPGAAAASGTAAVEGAGGGAAPPAPGEADTAALSRSGRPLSVALRMAALFDSYGTQRPELLLAWAAGQDHDGLGTALPPDLAWQPPLWRALRARIGTPAPAERWPDALALVRAHPEQLALPDRVSVFGPTRLSTAELRALAALGAGREVHLWLLQPSGALWEALAGQLPDQPRGHPAATAPVPPPRRSADRSGQRVAHPLLRSLGRDARELQLRLAVAAPGAVDHGPPSAATPGGAAAAPSSLLRRLQHSLAADAVPAAADRLPVEAADRSIVLHACHGRGRQVEVLREVLLGLFADDATLEPRDVIVLCPQIEDFAALLSGAFGLADLADPADAAAIPDPGALPAGTVHPGHRLRVRLADRALHQTNDLLALATQLLALAAGRCTGTDALALAELPVVRRRFGLRDDDLTRVAEWLAGSGVRWGRDRTDRVAYQLGDSDLWTWRGGVDRLLLGVTAADEPADPRWLGAALPYDDVDSVDVAVLGRAAEYLERLAAAVGALRGAQPLPDWVAALRRAVDALGRPAAGLVWQSAEAHRVLSGLAEEALAASGTPLGAADVRGLLAGRLAGRPTRANFRTGHLTVCTLQPMRAVPHRVVVLLGMDDGVFPRQAIVDSDDVLARDPLVGERDPRAEDRQLLLDSLGAATDRVVVVYSGADPRTGVPLPPAVPVGELLDALDDLAVGPGGGALRDHLVQRHPLHGTDARNFQPGRLGRAGPLSFDRHSLAGARARQQPPQDPPPFLAAPLDPPPHPDTGVDLDLDDLLAFWAHPVRGFLGTRLGLRLPAADDPLPDQLPATLDPLTGYALGQRLLRSMQAGAALPVATRALRGLGQLPPGRLGQPDLDKLAGRVAAVHDVATRAVPGPAADPAQAVTVTVAVSDPVRRATGVTRILGTVPGVRGGTVLSVDYATLGARQRLAMWLRLLALSASGAAPAPDDGAAAAGWRGVVVARRIGTGAAVTLHAPPPAAALAVLETLLTLRATGLCAPLPLPLKTGFAYADGVLHGGGSQAGRRAAEQAWAGDGRRDAPVPAERAERHHAYVYGPDAALDTLLRPALRGVPALPELARAVWEPALQHTEDSA